MFYCGMDLSRQPYIASVVDAGGNLLLERAAIPNNREGCKALFSLFSQMGIKKEDIVIGMVASGPYWIPVYEYITEQGYAVRVIHRIQADSFCKVYMRQTNKSIMNAQITRLGQY